ncbi:MAG: B12-binding domain-containing radical SAM protein [Polyangiales bacterium]
MRALLVSANRERLASPVVPLGVLYVAAAVRDAHEVEVVDLCFATDPIATLHQAVERFRPDVVGLGLRNLHDNAYGATEALLHYYESIARALRASTAAPLVLGGTAATLRPTLLIDRLAPDHVVVGEGERAFRDLVDALARGERRERVVQATGARADLDTLCAPARDLVDARYYELAGTDSVQTKRGCAFHCTYCDYPDIEGRRVRMRDPESVADEIAARGRIPDVTHVFVVDSVFNFPKSHARAVCEALQARGAPVPWVCYASPAGLDDELVGAMARAGCVGAEIGTDSGSARVLERLRKPFDLAQVRGVRALFRAHGLADCHTFVLGAEGETIEEARETLAFVDEIDPDVAVFIVFTEDREGRALGHSALRDGLLDLLAREAPKRPGWVVPELGIRFGAKLTRFVQRRGLRGPAWLHLATARKVGASGYSSSR